MVNNYVKFEHTFSSHQDPIGVSYPKQGNLLPYLLEGPLVLILPNGGLAEIDSESYRLSLALFGALNHSLLCAENSYGALIDKMYHSTCISDNRIFHYDQQCLEKCEIIEENYHN